ncbi:MAG: hypothetical protein Q4G33_09380 [bacterium]|nr:hypothetical protein [bacterium]
MKYKTEDEKGYSRRFGKTVTSGNGDIVLNGQTVKASGNDLGNMAEVTAGIHNLKKRNSDAALNEKNGNVMLGGRDTGVRARNFANGANDENMELLRKGYTSNSGDSVVRGRQSAESRGLGNLVRWDASSKRMTIAGIDVPYLYITDDGNAMVSERVLNEVMDEAEKNSGVQNSAALADNIYSKHSRAVNSALDKAVNRKEWSYDPTKDPAYEAYAKMYARSAEQAYNRAMGSGGLYGAPDSYQMYQALAAYADNMQRLSDTVPQLAQQDYTRYSDEQQRNLAALEALQNERAAHYNMFSEANENQLARIREDDRENYDRYEDSVYNYPEAEERLIQERAKSHIAGNESVQSDFDTAMYAPMLELDYKIKSAQLDSTEVKTLILRIQAAQQRAELYNGGMFMKQDMDALGIPQDMERYPDTGGYPAPWDAEINAKLAEWYRYTLQTLGY